MKNETGSKLYHNKTEISMYESLARFREPLLDTIIESLHIPPVSNGLDAGCGKGYITKLLARKIGDKVNLTGLDISKEFIQYARKNNQKNNLQFIEGNINSLPFDDNSYDWVWSMDTVWPGPREYGCPAEDPLNIINEFHRVTKPGGSVFLLFWSSQKLLPGHPMLEAKLNTTSSATAPFRKGMNPSNHMMNAGDWLRKADFYHISAQTFTGDITAPLHDNDRNALRILFQMLWGESESEVAENDWKVFKSLHDQNSENYILTNPQYYGFYTYTLFTGKK